MTNLLNHSLRGDMTVNGDLSSIRSTPRLLHLPSPRLQIKYQSERNSIKNSCRAEIDKVKEMVSSQARSGQQAVADATKALVLLSQARKLTSNMLGNINGDQNFGNSVGPGGGKIPRTEL